MSCMVRPFGLLAKDSDCQEINDLDAAARELRSAHYLLSISARHALENIGSCGTDPRWGCCIKRSCVSIAPEGTAILVPRPATHKLTEVINMCATIERLLDAIEWARDASCGLSTYQVELCHPTTSSNVSARKRELFDNDLILVLKNGGVEDRARFEVSDVVSDSKDGNHKERKDLVSLGVLKPLKAKSPRSRMLEAKWPKGKLFMVVSSEFSKVLLKKPVAVRNRTPRRFWYAGTPPHCRYEQRNDHASSTAVLQVLKEDGPD
jgi:hypothetical protein